MFVGVSLPFLLAAQQKNSVSITKRVLRIPEVTVVGKRPMKDIGVQRTRFDSIAMKENIALSMADVLTFNSSVFVKNYGRATLCSFLLFKLCLFFIKSTLSHCHYRESL